VWPRPLPADGNARGPSLLGPFEDLLVCRFMASLAWVSFHLRGSCCSLSFLVDQQVVEGRHNPTIPPTEKGTCLSLQADDELMDPVFRERDLNYFRTTLPGNSKTAWWVAELCRSSRTKCTNSFTETPCINFDAPQGFFQTSCTDLVQKHDLQHLAEPNQSAGGPHGNATGGPSRGTRHPPAGSSQGKLF
jgi:hypothetical protein